MARYHFYCLVFLAVCVAFQAIQGGLVDAVQAEPEPPLEALPPETGSRRRPRGGFRKSWTRFRKFIGRAVESLRKIFPSRGERDDSEFQPAEEISLKYIDCFSLAQPEEMVRRAISTVCARLDEEPLRRNCSLFALTIASSLYKVRECVSQGEVDASSHRRVQTEEDVLAWFNSLQFIGASQRDVPLTGTSALDNAFARLNWSTMSTTDNHFILASKYLKKSIIARRTWRQRARGFWSRIRRRANVEEPRTVPQAHKVGYFWTVYAVTRSHMVSRDIYLRIPSGARFVWPASAVYSYEQFIDEGRQVYENIPPHADPLAVHLVTTMLMENVSCPKDGHHKSSERMLLRNKPQRIKHKELIELAVLFTIEYLFDASDCAEKLNAADPTCRLLQDYDDFWNSGGSLATPEAPEQQESREDQSENPEGPVQSSFLGIDSDNESQDEILAPNLGAGGSPAAEGDEAMGVEGPSDQQEPQPGLLDEFSQPNISAPIDVPDPKRDRIRGYSQNAAAGAVAMARLSLRALTLWRANTLAMRMARFFLKSSFFRRNVTRILIAFFGATMVSENAPLLLRRRSRSQHLYLSIYVKALVELSTGNSNFAQLSASVAGHVAEEERRVTAAAQQPPSSFLQEGIPPSGLRRLLRNMRIDVSDQTAEGIAMGLNIAKDMLLAMLLLSVSTVLGPAAVAVAVMITIILLVKNGVYVYEQMNPEGQEEKVARAAKGAFQGLRKHFS